MKISVDIPDDDSDDQPFLFKAKVPISIFNQPLNTTVTSAAAGASASSVPDFSFSLSSRFPIGPIVSLTYSSPSPANSKHPIFPLSLSLKSGLGSYGSSNNSPLTFSAKFSVTKGSQVAIVPFFSLHFKPCIGNFSFQKRAASTFKSDRASNVEHRAHSSNSPYGTVNVDVYDGFEMKLEPFHKDGFENVDFRDDGGGFASSGQKFAWPCIDNGSSIKARTVLPLTKGISVYFKWGVRINGSSLTELPCLTVSRVGIESKSSSNGEEDDRRHANRGIRWLDIEENMEIKKNES